MPIQQMPPAGPTSLGEAAYFAEHRRRAGGRSATYGELLAPALPLYRNHLLRIDPDPGPGLTQPEIVAIYEYTTDADFIEKFNALMRDDPRAATAMHGGFITVLRSALTKLPPYEGQVWRGSNILPPEVMELLTQERDTFRPGYFWSTAYDRRGLEEYADDIVFDIQSQTGKNIAWMSAKGEDYEVLFPPGAAFRVLNADEIAPGKWAIKLADLGLPFKEE